MSRSGADFVIGEVAEPVRTLVDGYAEMEAEPCHFCMRTDLDLEGRVREVWVVVTRGHVVALAPEGEEQESARSGPFALNTITKARMTQMVGSAFLQVMVGDLYVDLVRCSNGHREVVDRGRRQLELLLAGGDVIPEALTKPYEHICEQCGLPLPGRGVACPRCMGRRGVFWRTMGLMRPYLGFVVLLLVLMTVRVGLTLIPPYLVKILVDDVLTKMTRPGEGLLLLVLGLVCVYTTAAVLSVFIGRASAFVGTRITRDLRVVLQRKLLQLSVEYYDRHSVGSLMSRVLYDVEQFSTFVDQLAGGFLLNLMTVLGIGCMLFFLNAKMALLVMLPVPVVLAYTIYYWKRIYPKYYPYYDSFGKMTQLVSGVLSGIRLVKAFGQEQREEKRFEGTAAHMQGATRDLRYSTVTFNSIMPYIFTLGTLIIWYFGGREVIQHAQDPTMGITLGTLMAFFSYVAMFYAPVQALANLSTWATAFMSAAQRVFEVLDAKVSLERPGEPAPVGQIGGAIELRNVTFGYDSHNPVIKDVSMKIDQGQFIGIVGKSGSGKTTLVNLICRFYDPQDGQVLIDGKDVREISQEELHGQVALVLQEPFLFRASIRDNIAYGRFDASAPEVISAARQANAHDFIARRAGAYDSRLGERGAGLSGGERQRVTIARAIIEDPRILILDEATSSVDTESELQIQASMARVGKGRTTIVIAHRLSTLKNADRIYVMEGGKIAESGTHEELLNLKGTYHRLVKIQSTLALVGAE